ncbi:MAG: WD40/YVTN/BNR-like repeat-containing protein, partial [Myxococcales bacterium]
CGSCPDGLACDASGQCACKPQCSGKACGPDGCGGTCGTCASGKKCDELSGLCVNCTPDCAGRACGEDGCGGSCGSCPPPQTCGGGGVAGQCGQGACTPETEPQMCARLMKNCGSLTADDNCGARRTVDCGGCASPQTCGGGGVANVCGCTPETDLALCTRMGKNCGPLVAFDNCEGSRSVASCGECTLPETCGGGGATGVCGCTAETNAQLCAALGRECGSATTTDRCGQQRTLSCGSCSQPETCGGGGAPGVCGCTSESDAAFCARLGKDCGSVSGTDNCGRSRWAYCGSCNHPETCGGGGTANVCGCTPETNAAFCARLGKECGTFSGTDNCGQPRTASCGSCASPESCGGGGTPNQCGCTSNETSAQLCQRYGLNCGTVTVQDGCLQPKTVNCGSCQLPETCGGGGYDNVCGCVGETDWSYCHDHGFNCGSVSWTDRCGQARSADCGSCSSPYVCGGEGEANVCGCVSHSDAEFCAWHRANCGSLSANDNCGRPRSVASCGTCTNPNDTCTQNVCTAWAIVPHSNWITWSAVGGRSANDVYLAGYDESDNEAYVKRYLNGSWSNTTRVAAATRFYKIIAAGPTSDYWMSGAPKRILRTSGTPANLADVGWAPPENLFDIKALSDTDVWGVGVGGVIVHWDGTSWQSTSVPTDGDALNSLWPIAPDDIWAATTNGVIAHYDGTSWTTSSLSYAACFGLWASGPDDVWCVGTGGDGYGSTYHWDGTSWTNVPIPTNGWVYDVWGFAPNDVWAVGTSGCLHWDGTSWTNVPVPTTRFLYGVWGADPNDIWAVGSGGVILHWRH